MIVLTVQAIQFKVSHQSFDIYLIIWLCACNGIYLFTFADKVLKLKAIEGSYLKHRWPVGIHLREEELNKRFYMIPDWNEINITI